MYHVIYLQESCELFTSLYRTWSHSPIATIALCLLTGCYRHAGKQKIIYISRIPYVQILYSINHSNFLLRRVCLFFRWPGTRDKWSRSYTWDANRTGQAGTTNWVSNIYMYVNQYLTYSITSQNMYFIRF